MADRKGNSPPPLLLCSTNDSITPGVFRPVPATASLFPTDEDGEADSFLGQNDPPDLGPPPPSTSQQGAPSTFSYFQQTSAPSSQSDPFDMVAQAEGQSPFSAPPPLPTSSSSSGQATIPTFVPTTQHLASPPTLQPGPSPPQLEAVSQPPHQPRAVHFQDQPSGAPPTTSFPPTGPPPTGPLPPSGPPPSGPAGPRFGIKGYQHKPMAYPMGGVTPASGPLPPGILAPPPKMQFDASRPPPTASEVQHFNQTSDSAGAGPRAGGFYQPIQPHWFYCKEMEKRSIWVPFSIFDSIKLEEAFIRAQTSESVIIISTNGGRYDVNLSERLRHAIYWDERPSSVRRCTWFYKSDSENRFIPYEESMANFLEAEYKTASMQNQWHRRLELSDGETIIMHNPNVIVHFRPSNRPDEWGASPDTQMRPRVVKRGVDDIDSIQQGESNQIDHLVFVVHGIGPVCDLRFRTITECVDDFRSLSIGLMSSHFRQAQDEGRAGRVEFLPVYWYAALHGDATGVDRRLQRITLPSITRLRSFTNETLLDILFYTSPIYAQQIAEVVCSEINRLYSLFRSRNPDFHGQVSLIGHSLGSLIVFDLLKHQQDGTQESEEDLVRSEVIAEHPSELVPSSASLSDTLPPSSGSSSSVVGMASLETEPIMSLEESLESLGLLDLLPKFEAERIDMESLLMCSDADLKEMGIPLGPRKKLGGFLKDQAAKEAKRKESALMKEQMEAETRAREEEERRRQEEEETQQEANQPTGRALSHAMSVHVDYQPGLEGVGQPFVNYPQLDFQPSCFFALGSPIGMFMTVRGVGRVGENYRLPTCPSLFNIFHPFDPVAYRIEPLIHPSLCDSKPVLMPHHKGRKRLHLELRDSLSHFGSDLKRSLIDSMKKTWNTLHQFALAHRAPGTTEEDGATPDNVTDEQMEAVAEQLSKQQLANQQAEAEGQSRFPEENLRLGQLNGGRRIDYVLQEAPLESFNEYLFAMSSHACYWESEDTVLMVMKEVYGLLGIFPQLTGPRQDSTPSTPLRY
ncbi:triacylglycerol hydrolase DDHD2-like [Diadema setosum]|uniref:triacylglycerol hydrolase DDHD2-like n=1 Tax=Diadema setosum TaxID=31175 RepID=UPI003B3B1A6D